MRAFAFAILLAFAALAPPPALATHTCTPELQWEAGGDVYYLAGPGSGCAPAGVWRDCNGIAGLQDRRHATEHEPDCFLLDAIVVG